MFSIFRLYTFTFTLNHSGEKEPYQLLQPAKEVFSWYILHSNSIRHPQPHLKYITQTSSKLLNLLFIAVIAIIYSTWCFYIYSTRIFIYSTRFFIYSTRFLIYSTYGSLFTVHGSLFTILQHMVFQSQQHIVLYRTWFFIYCYILAEHGCLSTALCPCPQLCGYWVRLWLHTLSGFGKVHRWDRMNPSHSDKTSPISALWLSIHSLDTSCTIMLSCLNHNYNRWKKTRVHKKIFFICHSLLLISQ